VWHGGDEVTWLALRRGRGAPWIFLRTRSPDRCRGPRCKLDSSSGVPSARSPTGLLLTRSGDAAGGEQVEGPCLDLGLRGAVVVGGWGGMVAAERKRGGAAAA